MSGLIRLFVIAVCLTGPYHMLFPVLPLVVRNAGGADSLAGALVAAMSIGAVSLQLTGPFLIRRWPATAVLGGAFAVSACAVVGLGAASTMWAAVVLSALFGAGFGCAAAIIAMLLAPMSSIRGSAAVYGVYAFGTSLPSIIGPPGALLLATSGSVDGVFLIAGLLSCVGACLFGAAGGAARLRSPTVRSLLAWTPARLKVLGPYGCVNFTYGAVAGLAAVYLGPHSIISAAAFLLVVGVARTVTRTIGPYLAKIVGPNRATTLALVFGAAGLALLTVGQGWSVLVAGLLYGGAYGFLQTSSLMALSRVSPESNDAALWSFVTDAGVGLGALAMAPLGAAYGYSAVFAVLSLILIAAVVAHVRM